MKKAIKKQVKNSLILFLDKKSREAQQKFAGKSLNVLNSGVYVRLDQTSKTLLNVAKYLTKIYL